MSSAKVDASERLRRKALVEDCLKDGFAPIKVAGGRGSALEEAGRRDGKISGFYARWARHEEMFKEHGEESYAPDWSLYAPQTEEIASVVVTNDGTESTISVETKPVNRAVTIATELSSLVTDTKYPVINPEAIVVDRNLQRRYNADDGCYEMVDGSPRTWVTDTLKVAPINDCAGKKFIFTGAQNDTEIHEDFWNNLVAYATYLDAEIVIGPWTYETQWWSENNPAAREYDERIKKHLCFGQMKIGNRFVFCGEMNTLPTASKPISDLVTYSRGRWAVFPHAKRQLKSIPSTDPAIQAHQVMTTGAVTRPKVIPRKAGIKSIFHQVFGAIVVEFDEDGDIFCRQITADNDGSFYDLDHRVADSVVTSGHRVDAIVCGDVHLRKLDPINAMATFGFDLNGSATTYRDSLVDVLQPKHILLHDIFDNEARNHHHSGDSAYSYEMAFRGRDSVFDEIAQVAEFLNRMQKPDTAIVVVDSNHDLGLERYIREGRYRNDGINVRLGLQLEERYMALRESQAVALDSGVEPPSFSMLEEAVRRIDETLDGVQWVHDGTSFQIDGIECGHHGFRGANGSRGTISGFAKIGRKMSIGDKHSPEIDEGVYCAGCMNLHHGYNKGPSSWAIAHIVHYPNGKRSIVTLQNGKWRAGVKPRLRVKALSS